MVREFKSKYDKKYIAGKKYSKLAKGLVTACKLTANKKYQAKYH